MEEVKPWGQTATTDRYITSETKEYDKTEGKHINFFDPWTWDSGWKTNPDLDPGCGMNIPDHFSLETVFRVKNST